MGYEKVSSNVAKRSCHNHCESYNDGIRFRTHNIFVGLVTGAANLMKGGNFMKNWKKVLLVFIAMEILVIIVLLWLAFAPPSKDQQLLVAALRLENALGGK